MSLVPVLSAVQRCNTSPRLFVHHNPHVGDPQASGGQLAAEAADNRLLAPELADGISRVKSTKTQGIRTGNGLSQRQAQALLSAPDITTLRGLRDRAILAVLLGCGLRRSEVATLTFTHLQQRDGRWCIVDLVGKHGRVRTAPMPTWVKVAIDAWTSPAGAAEIVRGDTGNTDCFGVGLDELPDDFLA
jgi:integrase